MKAGGLKQLRRIMQDGRVLRLFIINWLVGALMGVAFALALLVFDIGGIGSLLDRSDAFWPGLALLVGGFAITCGGVVCASAVMMNAASNGKDRSGGKPSMALAPRVKDRS